MWGFGRLRERFRREDFEPSRLKATVKLKSQETNVEHHKIRILKDSSNDQVLN